MKKTFPNSDINKGAMVKNGFFLFMSLYYNKKKLASCKGQLISKGLYVVFICTKNKRKYWKC